MKYYTIKYNINNCYLSSGLRCKTWTATREKKSCDGVTAHENLIYNKNKMKYKKDWKRLKNETKNIQIT